MVDYSRQNKGNIHYKAPEGKAGISIEEAHNKARGKSQKKGTNSKKQNGKKKINKAKYIALVIALAAIMRVSATILPEKIERHAAFSNYMIEATHNFENHYLDQATNSYGNINFNELAQELDNSSRTDELIFVANEVIGEHGVNKVVEQYGFENLEEYAKAQGFKNTNEWKDKIKELVVKRGYLEEIQNDVNTQKDEVNQMIEESNLEIEKSQNTYNNTL